MINQFRILPMITLADTFTILVYCYWSFHHMCVNKHKRIIRTHGVCNIIVYQRMI